LQIALLALNVASTRTRWLAKALNANLYLLKSRAPYLNLVSKVFSIINENNIDTLIIQLPTGPLLFASVLSKKLTTNKELRIIADVHTGFLSAKLNLVITKHSILNAPFKPFLRYSDFIIIHNETNYNLLPYEFYYKTIVLYDPFYTVRNFFTEKNCGDFEMKYLKNKDEKYAVYPASWHPDEPIEFLVKAWAHSNIPISLVITGRPRRQILEKIREHAQIPKIIFTGYIKDYRKYLCLLSKALFIISATYSDFDMQCSAYEALAIGKPIIASNKLAMRTVLGDIPVYFNYSKESLYKAISFLLENYDYVQSKTSVLTKRLEEKVKSQVELFLDSLK
jgi:glycosyltransferase involved in cell wall biosynthesis